MKKQIKALLDNKCTECGREYMYYETKDGNRCGVKFDGNLIRHFVSCDFCCNSWEISYNDAQEHVRIMDTYSFKKSHGLI